MESSAKNCAIVSGVAFACASLAFFVGLALLPSAMHALNTIGASEFIQKVSLIALLFGPPIVGALAGLNIGVRSLEPARVNVDRP